MAFDAMARKLRHARPPPSPTAQGVAPLQNPATRVIAFRLTGRPTPVVIKRVAQPQGAQGVLRARWGHGGSLSS